MKEQQERRVVILASAARLFAQKGIAATTVREIAGSVGMLSGSLYHHFPSKDAIAGEVVREYLRDLLTGYRAIMARDFDPRDALREVVSASLGAAHRHPHATEVYQREMRRLRERSMIDELVEAANEVKLTWLAVLSKGRERGVFRRDVPLWVLFRFIRDTLFHVDPGELGEMTDPAGMFATAYLKTFLDGFAAPGAFPAAGESA
ncbi:TetR/AcrR family transcriptional regulator [Amycolatopsis rhizosphaerae]|uniref:TetR/AcrR family transcriptional regulator n=1 Tax=Amycolatopsis rhizosphaerae TaxID=2053003 RepID=A0A558DJY9_9PSEU|nr:TetR/AcrR family transcriptional regulator [Amycolatopsis rhizosphaerae]TVT61329.1 TetR/AcrR family transcriptional regulator [Amycolatopsis rhizosphaerae]